MTSAPPHEFCIAATAERDKPREIQAEEIAGSEVDALSEALRAQRPA